MCSMRRYLHARQGSAALLDVYCLYSSCRHTGSHKQSPSDESGAASGDLPEQVLKSIKAFFFQLVFVAQCASPLCQARCARPAVPGPL
jgi:hypothetical protein